MEDMPSNGLYAITSERLASDERLIAAVEQAIAGGARVIQYRDKSTDVERRSRQAGALRELCRFQRIPFLINDDTDLAQLVDADGVHVGRHDISLKEARIRLGEQAIIGVSCYNSLARAQQAEAAGANYVAFGSFFPSSNKPEAVPAAVDLLIQARQCLRGPIVAIGGITPDNGHALLTAGADLLAVIHGLFGQADIAQAAREYAQLFECEL
ncbi:MAG: thiamine phosphate synthase [Gammaproteobacteria bacterium]|nr:thiamine phosphate synthase [Gammaproteobacteria bacterium]